MTEPAAFYCVSDRRYFLGAVGLINSLRLVGHSQPIYLLDCGLTEAQRELLEGHVTLLRDQSGTPPWLLKTIAPLAHPAEVMVLIDADMIVTRPLGELIERAAGQGEGRLVAAINDRDRFRSDWGELLGLGPVRRGPYLSSGLVVVERRLGTEVLELMDRLQDRVDFDRTFWRDDARHYPFRFGDQDVLNGILASERVEPERVVALEHRLAPTPPFGRLRVADERALRCSYRDGVEPYVVHQYIRKPWLDPTYHGVYSRLLVRLLNESDVAVRVPERSVPVRLRRGVRARIARSAANARDAVRYHLADPVIDLVPEQVKDRLDRPLRRTRARAPDPAPRAPAPTGLPASVAFYCMSSDVYFLGAVGLINSLRLVGHTEPIYLLDLGITDPQRELLEPHVELVEAPAGVPPWLAKTVAPLAHPAEVMVLIDADMIVTRPLGELIDKAAHGRVVAVEHGSDRFVAEWGEVLDLGTVQPRAYVCSGLLVAGRDPGIEVLRTMDDRQRRVEFERGYLAQNVADYPLLYLDQDVLNAVLASSVAGGRVTTLARRMEAIPPFAGLRVLDERTLRCAYEDGVEPYLLHHFSAKPWLKPTPEGIYTQLLRRLLLGPELAIRVPEHDLPLHLRTGLIGDAVRSWVSRRNLFGKQRAWQT